MGFTAIFGFLSTIFQGIFGFKKDQAQTVQTAIGVLGQLNTSEADREKAIAQIITAEATSGNWLAACWRPLFMCVFMTIVISAWFGYTPPNLNTTMSPMLSRIFDLIELGLCGYIPARSIEKIITQLNIGSVLKTFIAKRIA